MHDSYKKCYTNIFQTVKTICRIHNPSAKKGDWAILMFVQSYFDPFFNFSPKSIRKCSFIQMRSFRETHLKRTCSANQAGENSSFIFTVCVKSVPRYYFKLVYVILQMAVKECLKPTFKNGDMGHFNL